ncbi:MAG: DoxX family protein [Thermoanaerobaculales bacterium]
MNAALWIAAGLLAAVNLAAGLTKLLKPKEALVQQMKWASDFSVRSVHGIGVLEVLGAVGIVVPGVVGVATVLVPLAAVGLALLQVGAAVTNVRYGEANRLPINVVLIALAAFVAWGRFGPYPF